MTRAIYQKYIIGEATRLLSFLDRDPYSLTYGCFDRLHWAWGACDIANADLQKFTLPLAYLYQLKNPDNLYYNNANLLNWIEAAILFCTQEQSRSGGFDQWLPHDNSIVSAGFVMHDLLLVAELLKNQLSQNTIEALKACALRSARFLTRYEERHGFNSNHCLANAAALLDIAHWLPEPADSFKNRALDIIQKVIHHQAQSGAFYEYAGADLGYHTAGIAYLAACYQRLPNNVIFDSLQRAVEFSSHFLNRVSGNGGGYGTRGTRLLYPSGFEIAAYYGIHTELPHLVADIISAGLCVTPRNTDLTNLIPLMADYTRMCLLPELPISTSVPNNKKDFFCNETSTYALLRQGVQIHGRLNGGMLQIDSIPQGKTLFSSAGYMIETGKIKGFSGVFDGYWHNENNQRFVFETRFQVANRMRQSAAKFLIVRTAFFLLGNCLPINLLMKKVMAWLLIFRKKYLNVTIKREFIIDKDEVKIKDIIHNQTKKKVLLHHVHEGYSHFMGSARYFDLSLLKENQDTFWPANQPKHWVLAPGKQLMISNHISLVNNTVLKERVS